MKRGSDFKLPWFRIHDIWTLTEPLSLLQILQVLGGDHEEALSTCLRLVDAEEVECPLDGGAHDGYGDSTNNIRNHLALAMLGVDDDANSQCSVDLSSVDVPHSNKYLEEYLEGRFSRSASFED